MPNPDVPPSKLTKFFYDAQLTRSEREKLFKSLSLDEQYKILIYGNQAIHPPDGKGVELLAEEGPSVIPFLTEKLRATQNEMTIHDIIDVFSAMALKKRYDFSKDQELLALLDQKAQTLRGFWKDMVLWKISMIRAGKFVPLPRQDLGLPPHLKKRLDSSQNSVN